MARMRTRKHKLTRHAYSTTTIAAYVMSWRQHKWRRQVASGSTKPTVHAIMLSVLLTSCGKRTETMEIDVESKQLIKPKKRGRMLFSQRRETAKRQQFHMIYDL